MLVVDNSFLLDFILDQH